MRSLLLLPGQTESALATTLLTAVEKVLTLMDLLAQLVVLHVPSARTKYVVVAEGVTLMLLPLPTAVPPQELLYHFQLALLPRLPPFTLRVTLEPLHTESTEALIEVGAAEKVLTLMDLLAQAVVLQVPSARTKYVVVAEGVTLMLLPLPTAVPPQELLYHFQSALLPRLPPFTLRVTLEPLQTESAEAVMEVGAVEKVLTLMDLLVQVVVSQVPSARTK